MNESTSCVALLFVILFSSAAFAQDKSHELRVGGGVSVQLGPDELRKNYELGFNVGGGAGLFFTSQLLVGGDFFYDRFNVDEPVEFGVDGGTLNLLEFLVVVKYYFSPVENSSTNFYVLGGIGLARIDMNDFIIKSEETYTFKGDSDTPGMVAVGVGVNFGSSRSFFVEARINAIFTDTIFTNRDTATFFPVRTGVVF